MNLGEYEGENIDSETDCTYSVESNDVFAPMKDTKSIPQLSGSPMIQNSRNLSYESLDTTQGFLDVMGELSDSINELNKHLCIKRERNESLTAKLNLNQEEILKLQLRIQVLDAGINLRKRFLCRKQKLII